MQQHHADPGIFIRSMATRGSLGGLARATADLVQLMDAAGKDYVLVETVGVGQAEIAIASLAQVTVVVLVPGMGDDVQTIKAGILEIADIFAINKADQPGADRVEREIEAMLSLTNGRKPAIVKTVATTGEGVADLLEAVQSAPNRSATVRERSIPIHVTNLSEATAQFQSAGAQIQPGPEGHILIEPPPGVILELIEEAAK
jgi:LAO/AO transport system kinase